MFSSNPLDKSCIGPDCTSGRNNASNRFPVGMTSLGDENQQIRIQLAVHKYNSSANSPLNSRCGVISPYRHSFQNNSLKPKCYEGEAEGTSKSDKRNGNQYEGVGAFPTIHLRKNAVRYRPIRRFKDVKVSYPELPVNRFLSHLPEACPDAKSSTRSVLDVLEDLSGKKIHAKDENGSSKPKSKGLAGDYLLNQNVVYKPLFVQKPKISSVLTRDNTTQTLSTLGTKTPSPQSSNSQIRNDTPDPRAELRRKLAKQNNEIFASLSSSISLLESFSLKRKIDKVTPSGRDENLTDGSATKNPRIDQSISYNGNDMSKSANRSKNKAGEPAKFSRKSQLKETNSPTSPNKDRLTTIFLDMQNTSRKAQIFQNSSTLPEASKPAEVAPETQTQLSNGFTHTSNGFSSSVSSSPAKGSSGTSAVENDKDNSSSSLAKANGTIVKKPEANNATFNLPVNQVNTELNNVTKPTAATFQFGVNASTPDLGATKTSTPSSSSSDDATSKKETDSNGNKKGEENSVTSKPFGFAGSNDKSNFGSFKFGAHGNAPAVTASPKEQNKTVTSEAAATVATSMPITTPQFSFGIPTGTKTATSQSFPLQFGVTNAQSTLTAPSKPLFAFGQNSSPAQQSSDAPKTEEKVTEQKSLLTSTAATATTTVAQSIQSNLFKFGEKSVDSTVTTVAGQTVRTEVSPSRSADITFQPSANNLNANAGTALNAMKPSFSFGQKVDTTFTTSGTTSQEQKFTFTFGQKPATDQSNAPGGPKSTNLFSFGQKPAAQETPTTSVATNVVSTSQPATTQTTVFGLNASQAAGSPQVKFGEVSTSQVTTNFGTKPEGGGLGTTTTTTFNQGSSFPIKTSPFGFGTSTAQASTGLGTSTSNAPTFSFGASTTTTTQSTPGFGVSSTAQTTPTFGAISTAQSGFGMSSTTQTTPAFGATSTAQTGFGGSSTTLATSAFGTSVSPPAFGVSSTIQSTSTFPVSSTPQSFGVASTTQSLPAFKAPSVSQSSPSFGITVTTQSNTAFGVSSAPQSAPGFGASSTTQSTPTFAATTAFGMPTSSQASTVFGASGPSQPVVRFGAPVAQNGTGFGAGGFSSSSSTQPTTTFGSPAATSTSAFGASQSSFGQPFNNKPPASLRPTTTIFGQNSTPTFSSGSTFNANPSNVFAPKPNPEGEMFDQNKIQTSGFGTTSQTFGNQNKFTFGMQQSTSNATGFTTSPPNTTSPPVFSFGGSATSNTFTFGGGGGGTSMPGNAQTPFAFKSPTNEPFKFGTTTTKEGPGFGASPATFTFGQMNNNNAAMTEQKPTFSFGSNQASSSASSAPFAFGTTPSPNVFSFGGSTSGSTGSSFNFGTPTPGGPFGQTPTASPGAPFPVPGTFSIGSGSSQSRPRATSRPRRRP